jgi:hypothetical protein
MNSTPSAAAAMQSWIDTFLRQLDLAGLILLGIMAIMATLFVLAQLSENFDFRRALVDENEKPSVLRILAVGAFAISSWVLMRDAISKEGANENLLAIYLVFWSGAPIAAKFIEALHAKWTHVQPPEKTP